MPRCGSTSVVKLCKQNDIKYIKYFGGKDMGFWGKKNNVSKKLYKCILNHVGEKVYDESFVFTTVRNPYSRAISMFKHRSWNCAATFKDFCFNFILISIKKILRL